MDDAHDHNRNAHPEHPDDSQKHDEANALLRRDLEDWSVEAASTELVSPLDNLYGCLAVQPEEVCLASAHEAQRLLRDDPLYRATAEAEDPLARLVAFFIDSLDEPQPTLARVFVLCGILDLLTFRYQVTSDDFAVKADELQRFQTPEVEAYCHAHGIEAPTEEECAERAQQWMEAAASWKRFRNSVLGNEALSCWYEIATWDKV